MSVGDDDVKVGAGGLNFFSFSLGCYYTLRFFVRFNSDRVVATKIQKRPSQNRDSGEYHGIALKIDGQSRVFDWLPCCVTPTTAAHPDFQLRIQGPAKQSCVGATTKHVSRSKTYPDSH
jgi:hypothetical protein